MAHHKTPKKAKVQGMYQFALAQQDRFGTPFFKSDIFRIAGVSKTRGNAILKDYPRTFKNNPFVDETRGRKRILTEEDVDKMEKVIWDHGIEGRMLSYHGLLQEAGVEKELSQRTIQRALGQRDWRRCIACQRSFVNAKLAEKRCEEARKSLEHRPRPEDWRDIYFTDEFHVSSGASGRVWILRKPGERYCPDCIVERPDKEEDRHTAHFWGAVGYDFKMESLHEYQIPSNNNGKMTQAYYRDHILDGIVKPWMEEGRSFILEEDGDSGHGPRGNNIVKSWKEKNGLRHYFNCPGSPDWPPIEKAWRLPKSEVKSRMCLTHDDLVEAVQDGWQKLDQATINEWVDQIPEILQQTLDLDGKMSGN